jgi:hypothetical protein
MSPSVSSVEQRLRHALASLETLRRLASFVEQPQEIALFDDLKTFANGVVTLTGAVKIHLDAIRDALPATCRTIEAPGPEALALKVPDPTLYYLQQPVRDLFERLDQQVPAFQALAHTLDFYIGDVRHADASLLSGMASLIRGQGQTILQVADDVDAAIKQMQKEHAAEYLKYMRQIFRPRTAPPPAEETKGGEE